MIGHAPVTYVRTESGTVKVLQGEPIPDNALAKHVATLLSLGAVGDKPVPVAPAGDEGSEGGGQPNTGGTSTDDPPPPPLPKPPKSQRS
ncbi:MAG TPA: hypothetical protein VMF51_18245 [Nocardioides sp.]|uniref:hypothetical protein n=1 Tax=Nocardioides sp. TaxID=35761 RepID=UPI002B92830A|nr:hypothetical protein [Nocardioides sp.]HTW17077.1 hypothetical protein [Nocardioides sp.]